MAGLPLALHPLNTAIPGGPHSSWGPISMGHRGPESGDLPRRPQSQTPQSEPSFHSLEIQRGQGRGGWGEGQGCHQGQTHSRQEAPEDCGCSQPEGGGPRRRTPLLLGLTAQHPRSRHWLTWAELPGLSLGSERFHRAPCFLLGADSYPLALGTPTLRPTARGRGRLRDRAVRPCERHKAALGFFFTSLFFEKWHSFLLK